MNKRIALFAALLAVTTAFGARAQDDKMKDMMAKIAEYGASGAEHARFKGLTGKWNVVSKGWMKPDDKPMESKGLAKFKWILGGRFLEQRFIGDMGGQKFEGLGYLGYDKLKKRYENIWMDSMSTTIFFAPGQWDEAGNTLKSEGTFSCPATGKTDEWFKSEWKLDGKDSQTFIMYGKDETGKEFKTMEMTYTRAK
jgi:hypothetical protein